MRNRFPSTMPRALTMLAPIVLLAAVFSSSTAHSAAFATGGSSPYRDQVLWLTWGGGGNNGTNGVLLNTAASMKTSADVTVAGGTMLNITCELVNVSPANTLSSYKPGNYSGDSLDKLYNIGGINSNNQLIAGISRTAGTTSFTINCASTLGGAPYNMRGLVMADAESTNNGTEFVHAKANGTWNIVEVRKNTAKSAYTARKPAAGEIRFGPGNDQNTAAISFLSFNQPSHTMSMDFELNGGGTQAIAIGLLVPYADFGDAPASYGEVMHLVTDLSFAPDGLAVGSSTNVNTTAYNPGGLVPPNSEFLGSRGPSTEQRARGDDGQADDVYPLRAYPEEDAFPTDYILHAPRRNETIEKAVACNGTGTVAAWIDFNGNGQFDADERTEASCISGQATLFWTTPVDVAPGLTYARLRYSTVASQLALPTGIADDGEVEDHRITFASPTLEIKKSANDTNGAWKIGQSDAKYTLTVTNKEPVSTRYSFATVAPQIKVLDLMPNGIEPKWAGTHTDGPWACNYVGQLVSCSNDVELLAGASTSIELPVTITEVASGSLTNHASVGGGRDPFNGGDTLQPGADCADVVHCTSYTVKVDATSGLSIEKQGTLNDSNGNGLLDANETIDYTFFVRNTGAVTLRGVKVKDDILSAAGISVSPVTVDLAPNASQMFRATYQPTQAEIDLGNVTNVATAKGTPPTGPETESPPDSVIVPPNQARGLSIEKQGSLNDSNGNGLLDLGESIEYAFAVRNTGALTLTNVSVKDDFLTNAGVSIAPASVTLAPNASQTFRATYQPVQADIDAGSVTNVASAIGTPPTGPVTESPPDTITVPPNQARGLTIDKQGTLNDTNGNALLDAGETIEYSFVVRNSGAVTLTDVTVKDDLLTNAGITVTPASVTLAPNATQTFTAIYQPTQAEIDTGSVTNVALASGTPPSGTPIESPTDSVTVPPNQTPRLSIEKHGALNDSNGNGLLDPGETIEYAFTVRNTGGVTLTDVKVEDNLLANAGVTITPATATLVPNATQAFLAVYQPTQSKIDAGSVTNVATATGNPPSGPETESPPDSVTVPPNQSTGLTIDKQGVLNDSNGNDLIDLGESVDYTFIVRNTGTVTLTSVTVKDNMLSLAGVSVTPASATLAPNATQAFRATYLPTQADIDAGYVTNVATATGTPPTGPETESPPDSVTVPPNRAASLTIEKLGALNDSNGNDLLDPGETIEYTFIVRNSGSVTLTNVAVSDDLLAATGISISPVAVTLAPNATQTFRATYAPSQAEIDIGSVYNEATATGVPPSGTPIKSLPDSVTVPPNKDAKLQIVKTSSFNDINNDGHTTAGDTITYRFTITNVGAVTIHNVTAEDAGPTFNGQHATNVLGAFSPAPVSLTPRRSQVFTADYVLSQDDIDHAAGVADAVANTAKAYGEVKATRVPTNSSTSTLTLPSAVPSDITLTKQTHLRNVRRGDVVPYVIRVTNNANRQMNDVVVTDRLPSGFRFVEGSATIDGTKATPTASGLVITFENLTLPSSSEIEITIDAQVLSSVAAGKHVNRANIIDGEGNALAPEATATVEILVDPVFECGDIIGKVFDDIDRNGYQDQDEPGLPGVRLSTVKGWLITTDRYGRYHVPCAALPDQRIGSNFIMKLDTRTLPSGYRLTTENPRVVRLTAGKMTKLNFGASIGRVVRLDLQDGAYVSGTTKLREEWQDGIDELVKVLSQEVSVLRITYFNTGAKHELVEQRFQELKAMIADKWKANGSDYPLEVETQMEVSQ